MPTLSTVPIQEPSLSVADGFVRSAGIRETEALVGLMPAFRALIFLASDAASYITGVVLPVDGGLLTA